MQQPLGFLRVLADWLGNTGMVRPAAFYLADAALTKVTPATMQDVSWSVSGVDFDDLLALVTAFDANVGVQLALMIAFGLRRKQGVMFAPRLAEVPAHALPPGAARHLAFVCVKRGSKGVYGRYTAVRNERQVNTLAQAIALVDDGPSSKWHGSSTMVGP